MRIGSRGDPGKARPRQTAQRREPGATADTAKLITGGNERTGSPIGGAIGTAQRNGAVMSIRSAGNLAPSGDAEAGDAKGSRLTRDGSVSMRIDCRDASRAAKAIAHRWKPEALFGGPRSLDRNWADLRESPAG